MNDGALRSTAPSIDSGYRRLQRLHVESFRHYAQRRAVAWRALTEKRVGSYG
jgi:hypothetical protein